MSNQIIQHLSQDPVLKQIIDRVSFREPAANSQGVYPDLLGSIISQQLSVKVAQVIEGRFLHLFPDGYPHPEQLLAFDPATLRSVGLSGQKAAYLQNVAAFFQQEKIGENHWDGMEDEAIIRFLTQIKGVGRWTVEMILMFSLGRPDVMPYDDLGIRTAIADLYGLSESGKALREKMAFLSTPWQPYRSYACWYLWRHKDGA